MKHHPDRFGPLGGARWRGAIYGDGLGIHDPTEGSIYHGPFGFAPFQAIYPQGITVWWDAFSGVLWIALSVLSIVCGLPSVALLLTAWSIWAAQVRMNHQAHIVRRLSLTDQLRLWGLCWMQPIAREWSRLRGMLRLNSRPSWHPSLPEIIVPKKPNKTSMRRSSHAFWSEGGVEREAWLTAMRQILGEKKIPFREDDGWRRFDIEMRPTAMLSWAFLTVTEYHGGNRALTRVAVVTRCRKTAMLGFLLAYIALYFGLSYGLSRFGFDADLGILTAIGIHIVLTFFAPLIGCINLVHQAAELAGLSRLTGTKSVHLTTSTLAADDDSCQTIRAL